MVALWNEKTTADEVAENLKLEITNKTVLITGASPDGIGAEAARVIAKYARLVILAGRSQAKLDATIASIKKETPTANLRTVILDLGSFASVRQAAAEVNSWNEPIHVLINNAAVTPPQLTLTEGIETQFYGDHLAHYLFTNLILPRIRQAASLETSPRIINISSTAHAFSPIRFDDYNFKEGYSKFASYGQSKTANILFTLELAKRLAKDSILAYSLHPGSIWTPGANTLKPDLIEMGILNEDGSLKEGAAEPPKSLAQGAATHIAAAFDPSIKDQSGGYLVDCQVRNDQLAPHANDPESATKLWTLSEKLVGQTFA